nr:hypothetical protein [Tanacetum cinerariifolium]
MGACLDAAGVVRSLSLKQESAKKLKTSDEVPEEVKSPVEVPGEKVKEMMQLVPIEEHMDREDLNQLWALVKESVSNRQPTSDKEMELWVELKRLYEPDDEDQLWTHTQNLMHAPVEWKLYDMCEVHQVTSKDKEICTLVEKDYPLRKGRIVGNKMNKAFLLTIIEFPLAEEVPTASEESCHCQKKREATTKRIALLLEKNLKHKRRRAVIDSSYDEEASLGHKDSLKHRRMIEEINEDKNVNLVQSSKKGEAHETAEHRMESDD